jgi:hypothetical protein
MRFGTVEVRPLGGGLGCLLMVLFSVVASVVLTVLVNRYYRWNTAVVEVFVSGHYAPPSTLAEPGSPA